MQDVVIRPMQDKDTPFITHSWKESYRHSPDAAWIPTGVYFDQMNRRVGNLLLTCKTWVACNPEDSDHLLGFACVDAHRNVLHYVYIKDIARGMGICKTLLTRAFERDHGMYELPITVTHWTTWCEKHGKRYGWHYAPSELRSYRGA
jgi:L-amino acid N-acyltransferase YncA